ncbi:MAG: S-adenosylmethionine:tRNA ribosyltransferase-isomerase [Muribaculaceae bacterium]|nr:S-adenosylmethionine:tRNA ribosyltransferase-isomerase [Muribaculaceae bacterium]
MSDNCVKNIRIADFDYPLPDERIARHPLAQRDACRLLVSLPDGKAVHKTFSDLPQLLPADSFLVCNDTRVINARIAFRKSTGSRIEIFLLEPVLPEDYLLMFQTTGACRWSCLVGNLKRWKENPLVKELEIDGRKVTLSAYRHEARPGNAHVIEFRWDDSELTFASIVDAAGYIPIPPYLKRDSEASDADDYQTVYARFKGSVAAPTAGLHFTPRVFEELHKRNITVLPLTLHVGAGTFQPVKSEEIGGHPMHTETFSVTRELIGNLITAKKERRNITAVGTTSVRTLESLPYLGAALKGGDQTLNVEQWWPYDGNCPNPPHDTVEALEAIARYMDDRNLPSLTAATSIMIAPGFEWRIVDSMVTNFHQPQSTLLLLVSSFLDRNFNPASDKMPRWRKLYDEALSLDYRFLSYGDACLLFPLNSEASSI